MNWKKIIKKVIYLLLFIGIFLTINAVLCYLMESPINYRRWQGYELTETGEKYDVIAIGPSDCRSGFDPKVADQELGCKTFNNGMDAANYYYGVQACVDNMLRYQHPKTVLLYVPSYEVSVNKLESISVYQLSAPYLKSYISRMKYYINASSGGGAINRLATWNNNLCDYDIQGLLSRIENNQKLKNDVRFKEYDPSFINEEVTDMQYFGKGYYSFKKGQCGEFDYNNVGNLIIECRGEYVDETGSVLDGRAGKGVEKILKRLKKEGIRPVVLVGPNSLIGIYNQIFYHERTERLKEIARENDCEYYDLNMLRKEIWRGKPGDWADVGHMLDTSAADYTRILANILKDAEAGKDTSRYFYSSWQEFIESIDEVQTVGFKTEKSGDEVRLEAFCVVGPLVECEYSFVLCDEVGNEKILQEYSDNNEYMFSLEDIPDESFVRVYGRDKNNPEISRYMDYKKA